MPILLRLRLAGVVTLVAICLVILASPAAHAGLNTYYQEDFTGQVGEGITTNTGYSNASWAVDGASAPTAIGHAQVSGVPEVFDFYDLAGTGGGPGIASVQFETALAAIAVGNPAYFSYLTMTLNASLDRDAFAVGERLLIESLIDGTVVDTTTLTTAGDFLITHDLSDNVLANTSHNYLLRITATQVQNGQPSFTLDNILVQGLSVPEPTSMSLLGMGVAAMCAAGSRRRQKSATPISG